MSQNIFLLLFVFCVLNQQVKSNFDVIECYVGYEEAAVTNLEPNKPLLFSSPNFPQTLSSNKSTANVCRGRFQAKNTDDHVWLAIINGNLDNVLISDGTIMNNTLTRGSAGTLFATQGNSLGFIVEENLAPWTAFQAVVMSFGNNEINNCPLSGNIIDLRNDSSRVTPLTPCFMNSNGSCLSDTKCSWIFMINEDQILKVATIEPMNMLNDLQLTIDDKQQPDIYYPGTTVQHFNGTKFNFTASNTNNNHLHAFVILVSAVDKYPKFNTTGCSSSATSNSVTKYSNLDYINGYPSNQKCQWQLKLLSNQTALIAFETYYAEDGADLLTLDKMVLTWPANFGYQLMNPDKDHVFDLTFLSDSNTNQAGVSLSSYIFDCKCRESNVILDCNKVTLLTPMEGVEFYCKNMACNYTVDFSSCNKTQYFEISIDTEFYFSGDQLLLTINGNTERSIAKFFKSTDIYSSDISMALSFLSDPNSATLSSPFNSWGIRFTPTTVDFVDVLLTAEKPTSVLWLDDLKVKTAYRICTLEKTLEMFSTNRNLEDFLFYDAQDLTHFGVSLLSLNNVNFSTPSSPISAISSSNCFIVYRTADLFQNNLTPLLFRIREIQSQNCQDSKNVFQAQFSLPNSEMFKVVSTGSGPCEAIILASQEKFPGVTFSNIEATVNSNFEFKSLITDKTIVNLNSSEINQWQNWGLYFNALSIIVPPSSSISIRCRLTSDLVSLNYITDGEKGIIVPPSYSGMYQTYNNSSIYVLSSESKKLANFNVKYLSNNTYLSIQSSYGRYDLHPGDNVILNGTNFNVFYKQQFVTDAFLVEYSFKNFTEQQSPNFAGRQGCIELSVLLGIIALINFWIL